jgi:hypothetical protein
LSANEVANGAGLRADLLEELEAGETPTDEDAAKIKDAIAALGGVPGTEHLQPVSEPQEPEHDEHVDEHVNGWDESLVTEHAG